MKKRVGLVLLLIAVTVGMAFAQSGRAIPFFASPGNFVRTLSEEDMKRAYGIYGIEILSVTQTPVGINVTYSCPALNKDVEFYFTVTYSDDTPDKQWTNIEKIRGARKSSTWRFTVLNCYHIKRVNIRWN